MEVKNWPHRQYEVKIIEVKEHHEQTIQTYTDGSKDEQCCIYSGNIRWKETCSTTKIQTGRQMFQHPSGTISYFKGGTGNIPQNRQEEEEEYEVIICYLRLYLQ